eukprot:10224624-Ditylum_brightwellii.AAC.1
MVAGDYPKMDDSALLDDIRHQQYQMLIACPRKGHLECAVYVFGHLKKKPNQRIQIDSCNPAVIKNSAEDQLTVYLSAKLKDQTAYVDSDCAHDKLTRRSIVGLIICVSSMPVMYQSKHQSAVDTSTYGAEFMAMKMTIEEVMTICYMLRCIGVEVSKPSHILGDSRSVIINATVPSPLLKKKHM